MQELLLAAAITTSLAGLLLLLVKPLWGVYVIFIARPLVDATWSQSIIGDFKLTELVSTLVPIIIMVRMMIDDASRRPLQGMPLKWLWLIYSMDALQFSLLVMFDEDWRPGLAVLMRHLSGPAGFYMVQAYCRDERDFLRFAWALAIAGFFPMATGFFEGVTGAHWSITLGADDVVRNIGFYHDGITIRYLAMQTIMAIALVYAIGKRSVAHSLFCLGYAAIALFVLKGAYSKAGIATVGLWLLFWPVLRKNVTAMVGMVAAIAIGTLYFSAEIMNSVGFIFAREIGATQGNFKVNETFAGRWGIWTDMLAEWEAYPLSAKLFGAGKNANGAHNDYLQVLFHGGWLGLIIYGGLLAAIGWSIARMTIKRSDIYAIAALYAYIMWMVDTIGLVPSAYSGYQWFVWGIIGFCLRHRQDEKSTPIESPEIALPAARFPNLVGAN